ncbi:DNA polymerase I protein [Alcaligenes phage vB_Af_QDWS595]|uniref:DNA polymerase I protein n=1 Tax=Alcaligenes phage vB_Af_QDWS595 TaxID=2877946 RepID=A0AAE8Y1C7_9CAUD|nr:DNA polymerase I protein [Alcaligenes phage vB_Af_QDWS595]UCR75517.1 DNA polymerase I protein [Alcaligenes phage vB_Af_QDWS595]
MKYLTVDGSISIGQRPICFLVNQFNSDTFIREYFEPIKMKTGSSIFFQLHKEAGKKKVPKAVMKSWVDNELLPYLVSMGTKYLMVADPEYFKLLAGTSKAEANLGYVMDSPFGDFKVIYIPNHTSIFRDPEITRSKILQSLEALRDHASGKYKEPGKSIIHSCHYPKTTQDIGQWLDKLLDMGVPLTCDIEAFSLKHYEAGLGTMSFAWDQHNGIAFPIDYLPIAGATAAPYGEKIDNKPVKRLLKSFFTRAKQRGINFKFHNASFDIKVIIYELFMDSIIDNEGLLQGMETLMHNWDCTRIITYLATNTCAGNKLGLKIQAQEFAGNYAQDDEDIKDIRKIPLDQLLEYNLVDTLSTWFTYHKNYPIMVQDEQLPVYLNTFKPANLEIVQMELTGMPLNKKRVLEVKDILEEDERVARNKLNSSPVIQEANDYFRNKWVEKKHSEWKVKRTTPDQCPDDELFNPGSSQKLQYVLFEQLGLPILGLTKSKQPSTEADILKALVHHTEDQIVKDFLQALMDWKAVAIILSTFIPPMVDAPMGPDGWHYMFGSFNLGGTVSGRLSSSNPNMQNLPAGGKYGALIKSCFQAPPGWIFGGLDFASLEDRISALTTRDPNKLKVYIDGYDGHCLRAYAYWPEKMPDIDPNSVESINSIATKYKKIRGDSKEPTFLLTYGGTFRGLMKNCGFSEVDSLKIEGSYHNLYRVSVDWVKSKIEEATRTGYVTTAFGLRVRTPLLKQVVIGTDKTPYEAEQEARTAGNALGQGWCMLNNRACTEFMGKVRASKHRNDIRICGQIHDASYYMIRDNMETVQYVNVNLVKAVQWQDDPAIYHDKVKLGGELSLFYPSWEHEIEIPNGATNEEIMERIHKHLDKLAA